MDRSRRLPPQHSPRTAKAEVHHVVLPEPRPCWPRKSPRVRRRRRDHPLRNPLRRPATRRAVRHPRRSARLRPPDPFRREACVCGGRNRLRPARTPHRPVPYRAWWRWRRRGSAEPRVDRAGDTCMIADTGLEDIDADTLTRVNELLDLALSAPLDRQAELRAHIDNTILLGSPSRMAMKLSNNRWLPYRHLVLLNRYLNDLASRRILRLLVTMPPRHGKSWTCSRYFPAYYFARFPEHRIILTSYEGRFAARWGGMVRDTITKNRDIL